MLESDADVDDRASGIRAKLQYDPAWRIASVRVDGGHRVFVGRHDGSVRAYFVDDAGGWRRDSLGVPSRPPGLLSGGAPLSKRLRVSGSISALAVKSILGRVFVAFGTTAGHYGVWEPDANRLAFHAAERGWIRALAFYEDEGESLLLAASDHGRCALVSVDPNPTRASTRRPRYVGTRVDRFHLEADGDVLPEVRAVEVRTVSGRPSVDGPVEVPRLVVGAADGQVRHYDLSAPLHTRRRRALWRACVTMFPPELPETFLDRDGGIDAALGAEAMRDVRAWTYYECLSSAVGLAGAVGGEWIWRLLRVWDDAGDEVLRYALWAELESARRRDADVERRAKALAVEVYRREPFSPEAVKIVIDALARVANAHAERGLAGEAAGVENAARLQGEIEDLCWRWAGADSQVGARLLMHAFAEMFDWTSVLLLGASDLAGLDRFRGELLERILQTRLFHSDPVVVVESLRVINLALLRALDHLWLREESHPRQTLSPGAFADVASMVGEVVYRRFRGRSAVAEAEPLLTEAWRFFAGSLLLSPDHALGVGMIVSESRVPSPERVVAQAELLLETLSPLATAPGAWPRDRLAAAVAEFEGYLQPPSKDQGAEPRDEARPAPPDEREVTESYRSEDLGYEKTWVDGAIMELRDLGEPLLEHNPLKRDYVGRFLDSDRRWVYFRHSAAVIRKLAGLREDLAKAIRRARKEEVLELLRRARDVVHAPAALFEPQRTAFGAVVEEWDRTSRYLGLDAVRWLLLLEAHNRHKYQAAAADLFAAVARVVVMYAPFSMREQLAGDLRATLRAQIEPVNPAFVPVVDAAGRLADDARLNAAVLHVLMRRTGRIEGKTSLIAVAERFKIAAVAQGCDHSAPAEERLWNRTLRGPDFIWAAIFYEAVRNARQHSDAQEVFLYYDDQRRMMILMGGERARAVGPQGGDEDAMGLRHFGLPMMRQLCGAIGVELQPVNRPLGSGSWAHGEVGEPGPDTRFALLFSEVRS